MKLQSIKNVTIYCSSSNRINKKFFKIAYNLGKYLSSKKINLIYGGGSNGLMGEIARTMQQNGSFITGIIPKFLETEENMNKKANKLIVVKDMAKRKKLLFEKGDAFIVLPGGPGTIEEITEIISWFNLKLHNKPIILFNYNGFWEPLINMYKKTYNEKFLEKMHNQIFYSVKSMSEIKKII